MRLNVTDPAGTGKRAEFCPSFWGGKNWPPIAYSPKTRMIYIPANENLCSAITGRPVPYSPGTSFVGATTELMIAPGADHIGEVQAWNVDTGKKIDYLRAVVELARILQLRVTAEGVETSLVFERLRAVNDARQNVDGFFGQVVRILPVLGEAHDVAEEDRLEG